MRRLLTMVTMLAVLSAHACTTGYANAQRPPQATPGDGPNCSPFDQIKADAVITKIMVDGDGDWWLHIRYASTGLMNVGYLSRATGKFCIAAMGQTNRET